MSDFRYRNKNTGQVVEYDRASTRLEALDNWETLTVDGQDTPDALKYQEDGSLVDQFGAPRSSLLLGNNPPERVPEPPAAVGPASAPEADPKVSDAPPVTGGDPSVPDPEPEFTPLPPRSANKEAWVTVAMERGQLTREEAEAMTKPDLIDVFGEGDS